MKIAPLADVKARFSAYVEQAETEGPVVITRNGKPVAVLIAPENDEDLATDSGTLAPFSSLVGQITTEHQSG